MSTPSLHQVRWPKLCPVCGMSSQLRRQTSSSRSEPKHSMLSQASRVLSNGGVRSYRVLWCPVAKVLGTYHTAAALRDWPLTRIIEHDLRRARHEAAYPHINRPKRKFTIDAGLEETISYLDGLGDPISVDIETIGLDYPTCVGISDDPTRAICIPFRGGRLSTSELAYVWRRLNRLFRARGIIGQNIQFDVTRLERYAFSFPRIEFDTMLAHHLLYPEFAHDLGFIVSIYTHEPYYKHESSTNLWEYNCKDAACTYECYLGLKKELVQAGQLHLL